MVEVKKDRPEVETKSAGATNLNQEGTLQDEESKKDEREEEKDGGEMSSVLNAYSIGSSVMASS
jgi:hypothetical protein